MKREKLDKWEAMFLIPSLKKFTKMKFFRFGLVGLSINFAGYLLYLILAYIGFEPKSAMTIVYFSGVVAGFAGHGKITFSFSGNSTYATGKYAIVHCAGYGLNYGILKTFSDGFGFPHQLVQACAIVVVACFLFIAFKSFVFSSG